MARPKKVRPATEISEAARESTAQAEIAQAASPSQSLATRIWEGQSPDVSVIDRVARIAAGLKAQGMDLNIELPHPDAGRYLEAHK